MIIARAPVRLSLGGGGTDLPSYYGRFGGFVCAAGIDKYVYIYVNRPAADDLIRVKYSEYEEVERVSEVRHDLVRPALELVGVDRNIEIASMADLPAGTGLGSSGTYCVSLLAALSELNRERIPPQPLAELACHVEMDLAGHPVGKQDQYMAAFGGLTCLEIATDGTVRVTPLNLSLTTSNELAGRLLVFFTGISRSANTILEAQRTETEAGNSEVLDSLHATKEIGLRVKEALEAGRLDDFGDLMHEHWESKKRRSNAISDPRTDELYDAGRRAGALGGKLVGAGGGGFFLFYCPDGTQGAVREALGPRGLREMPFQFDFDGAKTMVNL